MSLIPDPGGSNGLNAILATMQVAITEAASRVQAAVQSATVAAQATEQAATSQANATTQSAQIRANADVESANLESSAHIQSTQIDSATRIPVANIQYNAQTGVANIQANADVGVANIRANADEFVANTQATAQTAVATTQATAQTQVATTQANAQTGVATINSQAEVQVANIRAGADIAVAQTQVAGTEYGADQQLTGVEYAADAETTRLKTALDFADGKWGQIFPLIQPLLQGLGSNPSAGGGATGLWQSLASALGAAPYVTVTGVWTPSQIQAQLNTIYARQDGKVASLIQAASIDLAGRGFSGNSPLLDVLRFAYEAEGISASAAEHTNLEVQAASANAEQLLKSQTLRQQQFASNEDAYARLSETLFRLTADLFSASAQMIGQLGRP